MLLLASIIARKARCCILYITNSATAAVQVHNTLLKFFHVDEENVALLDKKEKCSTKVLLGSKAKVVISTYSVLTLHLCNENFKDFANILYAIPKFGAVMYDEVHQAPAECYENALTLPSPCKIAASATVFRLDNNIAKLADYVGPLFHKIERKTLVNENVIPDVQVFKVEMNVEESKSLSSLKVKIFFDMLLLDLHQSETSICFFETINELDKFHSYFSKLLEVRGRQSVLLPALSGKIECSVRNEIIENIRDRTQNAEATIVFMSKVGQIAYDFLGHSTYEVRCSTISGQVAIQRIGRVQRKLGDSVDKAQKSVVFVATKTKEESNFEARRAYLEDEGYAIFTKSASSHDFGFLSQEDEAICERFCSIEEDKECVDMHAGSEMHFTPATRA